MTADRDAAELEQVARAISVARGLGPETLHQNYGPDEPVDAVLSTGAKAHYGWRHHVAVAKAALDASEIAALRRRVAQMEDIVQCARDWCKQVDEVGTGWDDWDSQYKYMHWTLLPLLEEKLSPSPPAEERET